MDSNLLQFILKVTKLSEVELKQFLALGLAKNIERKTKLAKPGNHISKAYFLKKGIVRHYICHNNEEFTKNFISGPRFMVPSLTNFFLETPSIIFCESLSELEVIEWDRKDLFTFSEENPKMYKFLMNAVVKAFHSKELKEISANQLNAKERYLQFMNEFPKLINQIPLQYIASYLGIRPETLSRIRANLIS